MIRSCGSNTLISANRISRCVVVLLLWSPLLLVRADQVPSEVQAAAATNNIRLNFPANVELRVLVDFVSQRLGLNIIYDEQILNKKVTLRTPEEVPVSSLLGLLESSLRMKGLALVDDEQPGFKRIVAAGGILGAARTVSGLDAARPTEVVTQLFQLRHSDPQLVGNVVKNFQSQPGAGGVLVLPEQNIVIVSDYASSVERMASLIEAADRPRPDAAVRLVPVQHVAAAQLVKQVKDLFDAKRRAEAVSKATPAADLLVTHDDRTNQLILVGQAEQVAQAEAIAKALDSPLDLQTRVYQLQAASPERIDRITRELVGEVDAARLYRASVDSEANMLIVTTTAAVHAQIEGLLRDLDQPVSSEQSPVRFYKLANSTAAEVLKTIQAIEDSTDLASTAVEEPAAGPENGRIEILPEPTGPGVTPIDQVKTQEGRRTPQEGGQDSLAPAPRVVRTERATITADANTNSIIVVAAPAVQRVYEQLIKMLDQRRPQVMVEATIVALDTSNGFSLGVEISSRGSDGRYINFSSFGLSTVDKNTGDLTLVPGTGLNSVLMPSSDVEVIIKALASSGRGQVLSSPKILVNDNATGVLSSVNETPFTSINASNNVATTSFAGFVSAGTTITVTPHISQDDYLQLKYALALNSFTGDGVDGIPPPRQTNSVESEITIPDGHTIVIGGLNRRDSSETINRVPILGEIPLLEYLFSSRNINRTETTLFVFLRPTILRNDQFQDLKYLSSVDQKKADIAGDFPPSAPLLMR